MKRIKSACLEQTIQFVSNDGVSPAEARGAVEHEVAQYKLGLDRRSIKYKVEEETSQPDGSLTLKIKRQYNFYHCGSYLD